MNDLVHHLLCPYCREDPGIRGSIGLVVVATCKNCNRMIEIVETALYIKTTGHFEPEVGISMKVDREPKKVSASERATAKGFRLVNGGK